MSTRNLRNTERLVDFSSLRLNKDSYQGSDEKYNDLFEGSWYMFKFGEVLEPDENKPLQGSYCNAPLSEWLGCHVAKLLGIPAQDTILGTYRGRIAVACNDFIRNAPDQIQLVQFNQLENSMPGGSKTNRRTPEYEFTLNLLKEHPWLEPIRDEAEDMFWKTLILDSMIGNFDRHAGNWGYFSSLKTFAAIGVAPVYDCGSSFYPRLDIREVEKMARDYSLMKERVFSFPNVRLLVDGKRPHYQDFLVSDLAKPARLRISDMIERLVSADYASLIDSTPGIDEAHAEFFKMMMDVRLNEIIIPSYMLALEEKAVFVPEIPYEPRRGRRENGSTFVER